MHARRKEGIAWPVCMCRVNRHICRGERVDSVASVLMLCVLWQVSKCLSYHSSETHYYYGVHN